MEFVLIVWSINKSHGGSQFFHHESCSNVLPNFNELERGEQANMRSKEAAYAWKQYIESLKAHGARFSSSAIASTDQDLHWLQQLLDKISEQIDILPLHWYNRGATNKRCKSLWHNVECYFSLMDTCSYEHFVIS